MTPLRLVLRCGDRSTPVTVEEADGAVHVVAGPGRHVVRLDGRRRSVRTACVDGRHLLFGWSRTETGYEIVLDGIAYAVALEDPRLEILRNVRKVEGGAQGVCEVRAPIPGLVTAVEVETGQGVEKGAGLLVLSAMKLENEILAPRGGRVREVKVRPGMAVEKNQVLVVLD